MESDGRFFRGATLALAIGLFLWALILRACGLL